MKLLILSDIHGNLAALESVLEAERGFDRLIFLGDLVGYGPEPVGCLRWAMGSSGAALQLQGNHDWGVATRRAPRSSPSYRRLARVSQQFCLKVLTQEMTAWLGSLSPMCAFALGRARIVACHAAPSDPLFRYFVQGGSHEEIAAEIHKAGNPDFLFLGHTHLPVMKLLGRTTVVNPGSVGQPKDGDPRASYALWIDGEVRLRRASYDIERTIQAYRGSGLAEADIAQLAAVLRTGGTLPSSTNPNTGSRTP